MPYRSTTSRRNTSSSSVTPLAGKPTSCGSSSVRVADVVRASSPVEVRAVADVQAGAFDVVAGLRRSPLQRSRVGLQFVARAEVHLAEARPARAFQHCGQVAGVQGPARPAGLVRAAGQLAVAVQAPVDGPVNRGRGGIGAQPVVADGSSPAPDRLTCEVRPRWRAGR
ncbi:hypothetical protein [Nonomuraea endophytica]|uniref:hypothetical protein n=1 Tax=Nonomuraea endophytica TaxID=714136 RepID=UPI0037C6A4E2